MLHGHQLHSSGTGGLQVPARVKKGKTRALTTAPRALHSSSDFPPNLPVLFGFQRLYFSGHCFWYPVQNFRLWSVGEIGLVGFSIVASAEMTYNLHPKHFLWAFKLICSLYVIFITLLVPSYTHFCCLPLFLNFNQKEVIHFIGLFREKTI